MPVSKKKKCAAKGCGNMLPDYRSSLQKACCWQCALYLVEEKKISDARRSRLSPIKQAKDLDHDKAWYMDKAQTAFNMYVRARDYGDTCISSGREMPWSDTRGRIDAGHYRSRGSAGHLRFHLHNCHAQSVHDNRDLSGNCVSYRINLINKIGIEKVEALEQNHEHKNFSIDYLKRVAILFRKKARLTLKRRGL